MRSNSINLLSLGLSLLMVSTWAMPMSPVMDYQALKKTLAHIPEPAYRYHVIISNLGVEPHTKSEKVFRCVEAGIHSAARKEGWGFPEGFEVVMGSEKNNNGREDPPTIRFGVHLEDTDSPTMRDLGWGEIRIRRKNFPDYEFTMSSNIKTNAKVTIGKESDSMMFKESGNGVVVVVGRELKKSANEKKKKSDKCCVM
ncbi:hypothetical protein F5878DRAFT_621870 [Lentinula raphanica]|uniref:Uncharacterized protein n=1 Tax=Lentinula raphanica TaxID=153919 RepID=A0AA38P7T6_9AGAR|nr:hypothetical protein F5878DRAFT_621870 [Lentinula raphanica]